MLDKISLTLLTIIDEQCALNGYRVFEFDELVKLLPTPSTNLSVIKECLVNLNASGYVSIKYQDEFEVCMTSLPKGRQLIERERATEQTLAQFKRIHLKNSLLGGFLGGVVASLLSLIIFLIIGV